MPKSEQILTTTDLRIINYLIYKKESKLSELYNYMKKNYRKSPNRVKDRLSKLESLNFIAFHKGVKKESKVVQIIQIEKTFLKKMLEKFEKLFNLP
jgi:predicted transcriptional regulator